jgi:hypothetical protein
MADDLGKKLAAIEKADAQARQNKEEAEREAAEEAETKRRQNLSSEIEAWKIKAANAILRGEHPAPLSVPIKMQGKVGFVFSSPESPDHALYLGIIKWAENNGLGVKVDYGAARSSHAPRVILVSNEK